MTIEPEPVSVDLLSDPALTSRAEIFDFSVGPILSPFMTNDQVCVEIVDKIGRLNQDQLFKAGFSCARFETKHAKHLRDQVWKVIFPNDTDTAYLDSKDCITAIQLLASVFSGHKNYDNLDPFPISSESFFIGVFSNQLNFRDPRIPFLCLRVLVYALRYGSGGEPVRFWNHPCQFVFLYLHHGKIEDSRLKLIDSFMQIAALHHEERLTTLANEMLTRAFYELEPQRMDLIARKTSFIGAFIETDMPIPLFVPVAQVSKKVYQVYKTLLKRPKKGLKSFFKYSDGDMDFAKIGIQRVFNLVFLHVLHYPLVDKYYKLDALVDFVFEFSLLASFAVKFYHLVLKCSKRPQAKMKHLRYRSKDRQCQCSICKNRRKKEVDDVAVKRLNIKRRKDPRFGLPIPRLMRSFTLPPTRTALKDVDMVLDSLIDVSHSPPNKLVDLEVISDAENNIESEYDPYDDYDDYDSEEEEEEEEEVDEPPEIADFAPTIVNIGEHFGFISSIYDFLKKIKEFRQNRSYRRDTPGTIRALRLLLKNYTYYIHYFLDILFNVPIYRVINPPTKAQVELYRNSCFDIMTYASKFLIEELDRRS
ncbi:hypothetical protein PCE1_001477 [Barthelona sp. PCE]